MSTKKNIKIEVWVFTLAVWIFALEFALYVVGDVLLDKLIKISAFVCMLLFLRFRRNGMKRSEKILIILFYLLLLSALVPSLLTGDLIGVSQWLKLTFMSMILPILILSCHTPQKKEDLLVSVYIMIALIFSIQAIAAFSAVLLEWVDTSTIVEVERRPDSPAVSLGILGFGNAILSPLDDLRFLRPQGWFLEPSLFASFLLLPAFVSIGRFLQNRKKVFLFVGAVIFLAFLLTVSLAGYISAVAGMLFFLLSKPFYRWLRKFFLVKYSYPVLILGVLFICANLLIGLGHLANEVKDNTLTEGQTFLVTLYKRDQSGPSGNLLREKDQVDMYISTVASNPLGVGFAITASENDKQSANAFFFWAVSGGIPAIVLITVFFAHIFFSFCHPLLISENVISRCLAASFIGHAIHNLSYGNWLAPYFLIHLALVVVYAKKLQGQSSEYGVKYEAQYNLSK